MARVADTAGAARDERGAVYVEFLFAFPPLFLLFLGICQLCLVATAKLVVQHSANRAARAAIVVLDDRADVYNGAARNSLSDGEPNPVASLELLLSGLSLAPAVPPLAAPAADTVESHGFFEGIVPSGDPPPARQRGARMQPILSAAYAPLLALAPRPVENAGGSLAGGVRSDFADALIRALGYTRAAAVVTVHPSPGASELLQEVGADSAVTVRVTYLYRCSVPLVRALVCRSLERLLEDHPSGVMSMKRRFDLAEAPRSLPSLTRGSFFSVLEAEATLPNQGAGYLPRGES